jgi:hypothetical protein
MLEAAYGREMKIQLFGNYCPQHKVQSVMTMLFNQLLDMPHLSGRWIILTNENCSLTGM